MNSTKWDLNNHLITRNVDLNLFLIRHSPNGRNGYLEI